MATRPTNRPAKAIFPAGGRGEEIDSTYDDNADRTEIEPDASDEEDDGPIVPEGYKTQAEFLSKWLKEYTFDVDADKHNVEEAMEDLRFVYVDQWDPATRAEREEAGRPCITINTLPQFIGQVVGDRRINKTAIKVIPNNAASKAAATVRSGLIKSIENYNGAERVYDACCEDQVAAGISNFEISMDYSVNDVFAQDIYIKSLANPFGVVWDRRHQDVTGKDAKHCFVEEEVPRTDFEEEYKDEPIPTGFPSGVEGAQWSEWCDSDNVKIVALWIMIEKPAMFGLMQDGQVEDLTDVAPEAYEYRIQMDAQGDPMIKEGVRTYAQRWMITGFTILEGPYELPLSRLPIIKVSGRVGRVGTKKYRFGLVRWARDASLMRNYWRSVAVETLAMAPRNQWLADTASVKGREDDFRAAHLTGDPLLVYNTGKTKPERQDPPALPGAVLNEATMNAQDIKDVTGLHDASMGIRSNEVSGKAIMARQREGDVATITFHDNLNLAILEGGRVMGELIPTCFDTLRTIRTVGTDEVESFVTINDPNDEASPDLTVGKYDYALITGPSYTTQRMEAADAMLEAVKVFPQLMEVAGDILVEVQDWPGSERISNRLKKVLPAAQQEEAEKEAAEAEASGQPQEPSPEQVAQAEAEQMQQQMVEAQMQMAQAEMEAQMQSMQLDLQAKQQEIESAGLDMEAKQLELQAKQIEIEEAQIKLREATAKAEEAEYKAQKARADADKATSEAEQADDEVVINRHSKASDIRIREQPAPSESTTTGTSRRARKGKR